MPSVRQPQAAAARPRRRGGRRRASWSASSRSPATTTSRWRPTAPPRPRPSRRPPPRVDDHDHVAFPRRRPRRAGVAPGPHTSQRFDDPVAAARSFAVDFVGMTDPVVGEFQPGDSRSGEVPVRGFADGAPSAVLVRQLEDDTWFVIGVDHRRHPARRARRSATRHRLAPPPHRRGLGLRGHGPGRHLRRRRARAHRQRRSSPAAAAARRRLRRRGRVRPTHRLDARRPRLDRPQHRRRRGRRAGRQVVVIRVAPEVAETPAGAHPGAVACRVLPFPPGRRAASAAPPAAPRADAVRHGDRADGAGRPRARALGRAAPGRGGAHRASRSGRSRSSPAMVVLLLWIPIRERPGLGTVLNVLLIGVVVDATLAVVDTPDAMWQRVALLRARGLRLRPGQRLVHRRRPRPRPARRPDDRHRPRGHSVRVVRTGIELAVLAIGAALGGSVGVGTVAVRPDGRPERPLAPRPHDPARAPPEDQRPRRTPRLPRSAVAAQVGWTPRASLARASSSTSPGQGRGEGSSAVLRHGQPPLRWATVAPNAL